MLDVCFACKFASVDAYSDKFLWMQEPSMRRIWQEEMELRPGREASVN